MLNLKVEYHGTDFRKIIIDHEKQINKIMQEIFKIGKETHNFIIDFIADKTTTKATVRNSTPLTQSIDYNEFALTTGFGWTIGNIDTLKSQAPHWHIINYGGKHPQAGKSVPGFFEGTDVFLYAPRSGEFMNVGINTVIEPMGYIEATKAFLDNQVNLLIAKYGSK